MKDLIKRFWWSFLMIAAALVFLLWQGWMFYFAPCPTVREYWTLVQAPGRCI